MKKIINYLLELLAKVGFDKGLHFLVGAVVTAICGWYGIIGIIVGFILSVGLGFAKEYLIDSTVDKKDIIFTVAGSLTVVIVYLLIGWI